jgi:hypothetical protein
MPDMEACSITLRACTALGDTEKAKDVVAKLAQFSLSPYAMCLCLLIKAYEKGGWIEQLSKVLARTKCYLDTNINIILRKYYLV